MILIIKNLLKKMSENSLEFTIRTQILYYFELRSFMLDVE